MLDVVEIFLAFPKLIWLDFYHMDKHILLINIFDGIRLKSRTHSLSNNKTQNKSTVTDRQDG